MVKIIVDDRQVKKIRVEVEGRVMDVIAESFAGFETLLKQIMDDTPQNIKSYNRELLYYLIDELKETI